MDKAINIFSDGAAKGNPGRGGYGVVILDGKNVFELGGHKSRTTNNEMELKAVVEALRAVADKAMPVHIYTDSKYVVEGSKGWIFGWLKNDWKTKANSEVLNKALWQELLPLLNKVDITWHKVPGHVGIVGNERADKIASTFAEKTTMDLYQGLRSGYDLNIEDTTYDEAKAKDRSDARKRQSLKAFSYISMVDGKVEVHQTWGECEAKVKGKKNVKFKKSLDANNEKEVIKEFENL